jgi:acetyl esterase/lipase
MDTADRWIQGPQEAAQVRRINKTLAYLPRFRIRNRVAPVAIQALLRAGQFAASFKPGSPELPIETRTLYREAGVPVPVRIIRPLGQAKGLVLDFHGGGWVIGNAQMDDDRNLAMARDCQVAVVSVDYRLAVSTPIQGLLDDCLAAARAVLSADWLEFAELPVILVGESAGGHLAAATLLGLKPWPELLKRISGAVLFYGVYDLTGTPSVRTAGPETLLLDGPGMVAALRMLTPGLTDEARRQPPLSPLYGDFADFPPALMYVGTLDPLQDDTLQLAERWRTCAEAEVHLLPESPHGFIHFPTAMAARVLAHSREWIRQRIDATLHRDR